MSFLRILLADDHEVVRQGIKSILESRDGWQVCGEAVTGREAVEKATALRPQVVVVDFSMPVLNGLEAARQIRQVLPRTEVIVLTMHDSERLAREFLAVGARGYVLKADVGKVLVEAVEQVAQHKHFFTPKVSEMVLSGFLNPNDRQDQGKRDRLTAREREIVQLVGEGKISKEIADQLSISIHTVETHRARIMKKLGLHTVGEVVRYAIRHEMAQI